MEPLPAKLQDVVKRLINSYEETNVPVIDELPEEPSALEFMRYVARNRPFVVRNAAQDWKALQKWNARYFRELMGDCDVNVAATPYGNADSVVDAGEDGLVLAMPHYFEEKFAQVIERLQEQDSGSKGAVIRYMQAQNDNLRNEMDDLFLDVPMDIPFARIALDKEPDAVNFWLGNSFSTTALHKDNYENIYVQVLGKKHFVLLPPVEAVCVNEQRVSPAQYVPQWSASEGSELLSADMALEIDKSAEKVPFATWDPDLPDMLPNEFSKYARPLRVTLNAGDMLYLPAIWYHKVSQTANHEGLSCSVNYWYDLDFGGSFWSLSSFASDIGQLALGREPHSSLE